MGGRPGDDYEVRSRIDVPRTRRGTALLAVTGGVVALWLVATLTSSRVPVTSVATFLPTLAAQVTPRASVGPSLPPAIERFGLDLGPTSGMPMLGDGGLEWFNPRTGSTRVMQLAGWAADRAFVRTDGSAACVCYALQDRDPGTSPRYWLAFGADGNVAGLNAIKGWPVDDGVRLVTDVALHPTGAVVIAWAIEGPHGWAVHLQVNSQVGDRLVPDTLIAEVPALSSNAVEVRLRLAPDGRHARIDLAGLPSLEAWTVEIEPSRLRPATSVRRLDGETGQSCLFAEWATPRAFVTACSQPEGDGAPALVVWRESIGGSRDTLELQSVGETNGWILDQTGGRLFLWEPVEHRLRRIDLVNLNVETRDVGPLIPLDVDRGESEWPVPPGGAAAWLPRGSSTSLPLAPELERRPLVGSIDRAVVYAAGYVASGRFPGVSSTGIWVFDAETLELLDRWAPIGAYEALSLTPDGQYVVAWGGPATFELATFGNTGPTMAFHDARDGTPTLALRREVPGGIFLVTEP